MIRNFGELIENLKECETYIGHVLVKNSLSNSFQDGREKPNSEIGRLLDNCMS